jgi:hypothetical protein
MTVCRQQALLLLDNLTIIQTLQKTEEKLQELLLEDKYPEAIRVLLGKFCPPPPPHPTPPVFVPTEGRV